MPYLAPAGTPISPSDIARWIAVSVRKSYQVEDLLNAFETRFGPRFYGFMSSGRAAMYLAFEALARSPAHTHRTEIVIPAFTCYSVPAAARRAGLTVRLCDIDPNTLSMDLEKLGNMDFSRTLAVVTANLYGIPNDLSSLEKIATANNVLLFDDAAQALGATVDGRWVGTFGDLGLFSFDKGKNITSMQGGALVSGSETIADLLAKHMHSLPKASLRDTSIQSLKLIAYSLLLPPNRYAITQKLPFLGLGKTPFTMEYPVTQYSQTLSSMTGILLDRLETLNQLRLENAQTLSTAVQELDTIRAISPLIGSKPVYTRFPVIFDSEEQRTRALSALNAAGIGATVSYPTAISDIPELRPQLLPDDRDMPQARQIASHLATLPTHPYVTGSHIEMIREILSSMER